MKCGSLCWEEKVEEVLSAVFALRNVYPSSKINSADSEEVCLPSDKDLQDLWSICCYCLVRIQPRGTQRSRQR